MFGYLLFDAWLDDRRGQVGRSRCRKPRKPGSRGRQRSQRRNGRGCHIPGTFSKFDKLHKEAGLRAFDMVNANCAAGALSDQEISPADFCLTQEHSGGENAHC